MNLAEQKELLKFLKKEFPNEKSYWVGGTRIGTGPWKWVTGETITDDLIWYGGEQGPGSKYDYDNQLALHAATGKESEWNPELYSRILGHSVHAEYKEKADGFHRHQGNKEHAYICELKVEI